MATKRATYADLLALPEDVRAEVIAGDIVTSPAALPRHSKVQRAVGHFVGGPFDDDPEARVLEALALRDGSWAEVGVHDDSASARILPFEAIELEVGRLFLPKDADE